jgi:hypothetical protein
MNVEFVPVGALRPNPSNARTHSARQVRKIAKSIKAFGFNNPILTDDNYLVIAGHGRLEAAKQLKMAAVPVLRLSHMNKEQVRAYILADNKLALEAGWDREMLTIELQGLIDLEFEVELSGFETAEIDLILGDATDSGEETYIRWIRPSDGDRDLVQFQTAPAVAWEQTIEPITQIQGSSLRGIILHKLMEEFLTGELNVSLEAAEQRSLGLIRELVPADASTPQLDVQELAATALRTITLKELSDDRDNVFAEVPVYGSIGAIERLIAGRADAVRYRNGDAEIVFDWKSDVDPRADDRAAYAHQLAQYVHVLRAKRGAIVYMTTGEIQWVEFAQVAAT